MGKQIRIGGLVSVADWVRRELAKSLTSDDLQFLRGKVNDNLQTVQQILRESNARVADLPSPSRRAYQFLSTLDWSSVRAAAAPESSAPESPSRQTRSIILWRGMNQWLELMCRRLSIEVSDIELRQIGDAITKTSRGMELTIQRDSISPDRLSPVTRLQRGWMRFLSLPENLSLYIQARRHATAALNHAARGHRLYPPPFFVHFRPLNGIYKLRGGKGGALVILPTAMVAFEQKDFEVLAARMFAPTPDTPRQVLQLMTGDGYQAIRAELESLGGIVEHSRGAAHDLAASFERVNVAYFDGKMPRPRLTWNRTFTGRKFGHYDYIQDTVMVSRTLDSPLVPEFVVDYLMFHELLHKFHGIHWVNGRGYAHTSEFYHDERKFMKLKEADEMLDRLAQNG